MKTVNESIASSSSSHMAKPGSLEQGVCRRTPVATLAPTQPASDGAPRFMRRELERRQLERHSQRERKAAVVIQRMYRGRYAQRRYEEQLRQRHSAAGTLQRMYRQHLCAVRATQRRQLGRQRHAAAARIQAVCRGRQVRQGRAQLACIGEDDEMRPLESALQAAPPINVSEDIHGALACSPIGTNVNDFMPCSHSNVATVEGMATPDFTGRDDAAVVWSLPVSPASSSYSFAKVKALYVMDEVFETFELAEGFQWRWPDYEMERSQALDAVQIVAQTSNDKLSFNQIPRGATGESASGAFLPSGEVTANVCGVNESAPPSVALEEALTLEELAGNEIAGDVLERILFAHHYCHE